MIRCMTAILSFALTMNTNAPAAAQEQQPAWQPVPGRLMTRWAADVSPASVHPEYPRPMMARDEWLSLNGLWDYAIAPIDARDAPQTFEGAILVPFPLESALSGVGRRLEPDQALWYRRTFSIPADWSPPQQTHPQQGDRILLHFGAVDWECEVRINGRSVGTHSGGYDSFTFDITDALQPNTPNELIVLVRDPTDAGAQPRGKQIRNPHGIWYTPISGIWQTVWLEAVPHTFIQSLEIDASMTEAKLQVRVAGDRAADLMVQIDLRGPDGTAAARQVGDAGGVIALRPENVRTWSPDDPFLYQITVALMDRDRTIDAVTSHVGFRSISVGSGPHTHGVTRLLLNGQPLFQFGPLDQGYWPDGLYTAPTEDALRFDVEVVKKMGGNMLRKHVKVEPQRFYWLCDRLGVLVWQDIPSPTPEGATRNTTAETPAARAQFELEAERIIGSLRNHPSIVMWVPFNEGWGQYDTRRIAEQVKALDPSRLVNNASGWTDAGAGDVIDVHAYPGPGMAPAEKTRASVLGEFGGLGLPIDNHTWVDRDNWGYVSYKSREELTSAYIALLEKLPPLIAQGLSAAVYTQTTDVEIECNGWLTYDREIFKIDPEAEAVSAATAALYAPPPRLRTIVPTSAEQRQAWRFTTQQPPANWHDPAFDDSSWATGEGGFGTRGTPGASIATQWNTPAIWIRRTITLPDAALVNPHLKIHHDEDAEVYLDGRRSATLKGYTTSYLLEPLSAEARAMLKPGATLTLAIHCQQTRGGQYIDAGIVDVIPAAR